MSGSNSNNNLNESELEQLNLGKECSDDEAFLVVSTATNFEKESKTIDVKKIKTQSDLENLKKKDPFGYYSLPGVREGDMAGNIADLSAVLVAAASQGNKMVRWRSSISYECFDIDIDLDDATADERESEDEFEDKVEGKEDYFDTFIEIFDAKSSNKLA